LEGQDPRTQLKILDEYLATHEDITGQIRRQRDELKNQVVAAENVKIEYESAENHLKGIQDAAEGTTDALGGAVTQASKLSDYMYGIYKILGTEDKKAFGGLISDIQKVDSELADGLITQKEYFENLNKSLESVDAQELFKIPAMPKTGAGEVGAGYEEQLGNAQSYFSALTMFASDSLSQISNDFDAGKMTLEDYTASLMEIGNTFNIVGDMASTMGINVGDSLGSMSGGIAELSKMQEMNALIEEDFYRINEMGLEANTDLYNQQMQLLADAAMRSGQTFVDMQGNALNSTEALFGYMAQSTANFEAIANQAGYSTGEAIQKIVNSAGNMLVKLGETISNFKGNIHFSAVDSGVMQNFDVGVLGQTIKNAIQIPEFDLGISGSADFADIGGIVKDFGLSLSGMDKNYDAGIYQTKKIDAASNAYDGLADSIDKVGGASKQANEAEKDYQDLLSKTISMLKQRKEDEKEALEEQLEGYKRIINARKDLIDQQKKEREHLNKTGDLNKDIAYVQSELMELQFDTSEEGRKRRLELDEELADKQRDLEDEQYDYSADKQKEALDDEYERFEDIVDAKIKVIEDYLEQTGTITAEAIALLEGRSDAFYQSLLEWNRVYGSGVDNDIVSAWDRAFNAVATYASAANAGIASANALTAANNKAAASAWATYDALKAANDAFNERVAGTSLDDVLAGWGLKRDTVDLSDTNRWSGGDRGSNIPHHHDGGFAGGAPTISSAEEFAVLMKGEHIDTPSQMTNFIKKTLPNIVSTAQELANNVTITMPITVQGNLDKTVLPELKSMISDTIYGAMRKRGFATNANNFSV
jgi:hypothetical protein